MATHILRTQGLQSLGSPSYPLTMSWHCTYSILRPVPADRVRPWIDDACAALPLHPPPRHNPLAPPPRIEQGSYVGVHRVNALTISEECYPLAREIATAHGLIHLELRAQDADHWDFTLFQNDAIVADFSTRVRHFDAPGFPTPRPFKEGTRDAFLNAWGGNTARLRPYLIDWDGLIIRKHRKVHPEDEYTTNNVYQVFDFMRELGAAAPHGHPDRFEFTAPAWKYPLSMP